MELTLKGKSSVTVVKTLLICWFCLEFFEEQLLHIWPVLFTHSSLFEEQGSNFKYLSTLYQINSKAVTANQCFSADCFQGSGACNGRVLATWWH